MLRFVFTAVEAGISAAIGYGLYRLNGPTSMYIFFVTLLTLHCWSENKDL